MNPQHPEKPADSGAAAPEQSASPGQRLESGLISIRGARTHNLKNIDIDLPRHRLVVITGMSGSGKSSLAFHTLYAEGQRRYVESLSAYARQFLGRLDKPDVDLIEGLSPAISIEQKATSHNPRSTVGTVTEINDYLRLLYARAGTPYCPEHQVPLASQTVSQMVDAVLSLPQETALMILAPVARERKGEFADLFDAMRARGYVRFRVDGRIVLEDDLPALRKNERHDIDVVVDRLRVRPQMRQRLAESFEAALAIGGANASGRVIALEMDSGAEHSYSAKFACPHCDYTLQELEPRLFSFNAPLGACPDCDGLGQREVFEAARVVSFPGLSLAAGAIRGWDRRNAYYYSMLESLGRHYGFDPEETPYEQLPAAVQHVLLFGSGEEEIVFLNAPQSGSGKGQPVERSYPFEGIVRNMERRFRETDSNAVRDELAKYRSTQVCPSCHGARLRREALFVRVGEGADARGIHEVCRDTLSDAWQWFEQLQLSGAKADIAAKVVREISTRLRFLNDVGLNYLSLERSAETLSGGEAQRIRLASQIGSGLTGVMYVLDEPSIGLHQRDNDRLIATLKHLRDIGNTVVVVEHDEDMMRAADQIVDMGPGAGVHGGQVVAQGDYAGIAGNPASLTGQYLSGKLRIEVPAVRTPWRVEAAREPHGTSARGGFHSAHRQADAAHPAAGAPAQGQALVIRGARGNNLRNVEVAFPVGLLICVTGVSGSGKSTLVNDTLYAAVAQHLYRTKAEPAAYDEISGMDCFDKVINVDQAPIGRTPRSNPATYTGLLTPVRELLAETSTARERGYGPGRFSFNVAGGRCEACQGDGVVKVEMHFLPDVYVPCDVCHGRRYNRETLEVLWKGRNIADILAMTVEEALGFFQDVPALARKLQTLMDVGLSYIRLGQSATTLSGGEAQRVKLALELSRRDTGRTLYILDEPTTGLHFADIALLVKVLQQLREAGNTIIVIEHNLDIIKVADWLIDMGPEGGRGGGQVIAQGTPEAVAAQAGSYTGHYLAPLLAKSRS